MTDSQIRMSKEFPMPNVERRNEFRRLPGHLSFVIRHYLVIRVSSLVIWLLTLAIRTYQLTISPALTLTFGANGGCRFTPSCSQYAIEAFRQCGVLAGGALAVKRVCRCHPWGGCGCDPIEKPEDGPEPAHCSRVGG
jgi:putative membrane protein insertion efficiency factor